MEASVRIPKKKLTNIIMSDRREMLRYVGRRIELAQDRLQSRHLLLTPLNLWIILPEFVKYRTYIDSDGLSLT
jgi:hypothetical protein